MGTENNKSGAKTTRSMKTAYRKDSVGEEWEGQDGLIILIREHVD